MTQPTATIFDPRPCSLGEGPLWHPDRSELFWFDINADRMMTKSKSWDFDFTVSAAGWVDRNTLVIASDHGLYRFDIPTGAHDKLCDVEADNPITRSNDSRADPQGGFWIGTMGRNTEKRAGGIYRYYKGEVRPMVPEVTIANSISFPPSGTHAYYTDTPRRRIWRFELDQTTGWPTRDPEVWLDLRPLDVNPDGAVFDAAGTFWVACWGTGVVLGFDEAGQEIARLPVPGLHATCPAFGGPELRDLFVTSATDGLTGDLGDNGKTFLLRDIAQGQAEHRVIL